MKKNVFLVSVLLFNLVFSLSLFSEGGKYDDLKELLVKQQKMIEEYVASGEKAKTALDVVKMYNVFTYKMKELMPMIITLAKKYNNLSEFFQGKPPEELKPDIEKLKLLGQKMQAVGMKLMPFMNDPGVRKASEELTKVSMEIQKAAMPKAPGKKEEKKKEEKKEEKK